MKSSYFNLILCCLFLLTDFCFAQLANSPWPMFQHDEQHTGRSPYRGPEHPYIKWDIGGGSRVFTTIGINNRIYISRMKDYVYEIPDLISLDLYGNVLWWNKGNTPAAIDLNSNLYVTYSNVSKFTKYDFNGNLLWSISISSSVDDGPGPAAVIDDAGTIYTTDRKSVV